MSFTDAGADAVSGTVWHPRFNVYLGHGLQDAQATPDLYVPTAISVLTQKNNFYQADRFKVTFSLWVDAEHGYAFWAEFNTLSIRVDIGFPEDGIDFHEVFRGFVDKIVIDAVKGIVTLTGRNCFGLLIDRQLHRTDQEATIGESIIDSFAKAGVHDPVFEEGFPADQVYGRYYQDKHTNTTQANQSMINTVDLAMKHVQQVGGNMWEDQGIIHFDMGIGGESFDVLAPQGKYEGHVTKLSPVNVTYLTMEHDLEFSQWAHQTIVTSQQPNGKSHRAIWPGDLEDGPNRKPHYMYTYNLSPEDTDQLAHSLHNEYMFHEYVITWKCAGPYILTMLPRDKFNIIGTNSIFDGFYQVMQIEHSLDFHRGYVGTVRGQWGKTDNGGNAGA